MSNGQSETVENVEREVIRRLQIKFWFFAAAVVLLSYFGVKEIVRQVTDNEIRAAFRAAILAEDKAKKAADATEEATKLSAGYAKTVGTLQEDAARVQALFVALRQRVDSESSSLKARAEKTSGNVEARLSRLEDLVAKLAQDTQASRQAIEAYRRDSEKIKATVAADAKRFVENGQYAVNIQFTSATKQLAEKAQDILARSGFKVATSDIAQLERFFYGASAGATTTNVTTTPPVNTIRFTASASPKVQEVRDLLSPVVQIKKTEQLATDKVTWGTIGLEFPQSRISVYLVEKP